MHSRGTLVPLISALVCKIPIMAHLVLIYAGRIQPFRTCYTTTRGNMMIDQNTRVICQGFTGKQVCIHIMAHCSEKVEG